MIRNVLFLCAANSARSQMAEGLARAVFPPEVAVWSAGSAPKGVRQEAIIVLKELGLDISGQKSKSVSDIPAPNIDLVVTLCKEESCPAFLGAAKRLHWPLPDPAKAHGVLETRLEEFRKTRDELRRRIELLAGSIEFEDFEEPGSLLDLGDDIEVE
jgi:protein-tyrosine-phosphatase